jgi:hypothetical protein
MENDIGLVGKTASNSVSDDTCCPNRLEVL